MINFFVDQCKLIPFCLLAMLPSIYGTWNRSLTDGLGFEIAINLGCALVFLVYNCCASELTSTLPFPGGSYALARCTVGFFPGYLVGCAEIVYYLICLSFSNAVTVYLLGAVFPSLENFGFIILASVIMIQIMLTSLSRQVMWATVGLFGVFVVILNLSLLSMALGELNFRRYAYSQPGFHSDLHNVHLSIPELSYTNADGEESGLFSGPPPSADSSDPSISIKRILFVGDVGIAVFRNIPLIYYIYMSCEFVNLLVDEVHSPRTSIPFAQIFSGVIVIVHNLVFPIVLASMDPGVNWLSLLSMPLTPSMAHVFRITQQTATCLQLVGTFGYSLCACIASSKLIVAMADSGLLHQCLSSSNRGCNCKQPLIACIAAQGIGLLLCFIASKADGSFSAWPFLIGVFALSTYIVQLIGFVQLRLKLSSFPRQYRSPFGVISAILAIAVFACGVVACFVLHYENFIIVTTFLAIASFFYVTCGRQRQSFSAAELAVMLPAHAEVKTANEYYYNRFPALGAIMRWCMPDRKRHLGLHAATYRPLHRHRQKWTWRHFHQNRKRKNRVMPLDDDIEIEIDDAAELSDLMRTEAVIARFVIQHDSPYPNDISGIVMQGVGGQELPQHLIGRCPSSSSLVNEEGDIMSTLEVDSSKTEL